MRFFLAFFIYKTSPQLDMDATANCDALPELPLVSSGLGPAAVTVTNSICDKRNK